MQSTCSQFSFWMRRGTETVGTSGRAGEERRRAESLVTPGAPRDPPPLQVHSMRDCRAQSTHAAFALRSETYYAPSQFNKTRNKWCFWHIPRTNTADNFHFATNSFGFVLFILFFVSAHWRWSVYFQFCRLFTVSTCWILVLCLFIQLISVANVGRYVNCSLWRRSNLERTTRISFYDIDIGSKRFAYHFIVLYLLYLHIAIVYCFFHSYCSHQLRNELNDSLKKRL